MRDAVEVLLAHVAIRMMIRWRVEHGGEAHHASGIEHPV
jgi:hypothetical protein